MSIMGCAKGKGKASNPYGVKLEELACIKKVKTTGESKLNFEEYEKIIAATARYPRIGNNICYPALGLTGEAGEVADKIKKIERDQGGVWNEENKRAICKELGDVLWYVTALSHEFGLTLNEVASENIEKLMGRRERGTLSGSGDDR